MPTHSFETDTYSHYSHAFYGMNMHYAFKQSRNLKKANKYTMDFSHRLGCHTYEAVGVRCKHVVVWFASM